MATASFRGTDPSHTQLTWNGVPLNSPLLGMADFSQIPLSIADGIDLYHGSASLLSGYPAIGGRIDLSGNPVWNKGFGLDLMSAAGSFHTFDEAAAATYSSKKLSIKSSLWYSASRNDFEFYNRDILNGGIQQRENAAWQRYGFMADTYLRLKGNNTLSLKLWTQQGSRSIPQLSTNESGSLNNLNRQTDNALHAIVSYDRFTNRSSLSLQSALSQQNTVYTLRNYISGSGYLNAVNSTGNGFSLYNFADYKIEFGKKWFLSTFIQFDFHHVTSDESVSLRYYDVKRTESSASVALLYKPFSSLSLGVSLRQQLSGSNWLKPMPAVQVEYRLLPTLVCKANVSRVLRSPSLNDLYFQPGGNPDLLPEESLMAEAGVQWSYKHKKFDVIADVTGFRSNIINWIMWRPTLRGYWTPENIASVQTCGIEAGLKAGIRSGKYAIQINTGYTLSQSVNKTHSDNTEDLSYGAQLPYIPLHSAMIYSTISRNGFYIGYQWNYYSERQTSTAESSSRLVSLYPYFMSDLSAGKQFDFDLWALHLRIGVMNLFNESYRSVLWQPMPGRNYMLTLRCILK